jgi:hypothetical protein
VIDDLLNRKPLSGHLLIPSLERIQVPQTSNSAPGAG